MDCLISDGVLHIFGGREDKIGNNELYKYLIVESGQLSRSNNVKHGIVRINDMEYYYSLRVNDKQDMIDIIEAVYKGARKGKGLVISPKDYSTKYKY